MISKVKTYLKSNVQILIFLVIAITVIFFIPMMLYFLEQYLKLILSNKCASNYITDFFNNVKNIMSIPKDFILALCPIITLIINNSNNKKILEWQKQAKIIDNYELEKRKALDEFVSFSIECLNNDTSENHKNFIKSFFKLRIYFKTIDKDFFKNIESLINEHKEFSETKITFFKTLEKLEKEIQKF